MGGVVVSPEQQEYLGELLAKRTMGQPWFHGYLDKDSTIRALTNVQPGYFLVRISESTPGGYVVAYVATDGSVVQSKVYFQAQRGFTADMGKTYYASLPDLVTAYAVKLQYPRKRIIQSGYAQLNL